MQRPSSAVSDLVSDLVSSSPVSMPSSPPMRQVSVPYRHAAVRQSSLLRIMHTAGSQPSPASSSSSNDRDLPDDGDERDGIEIGHHDFLPSPATKIRSYRPRSKTYTYVESEADPPTPPSKPRREKDNSLPGEQTPYRSDGLTFRSVEHPPRERHAGLDAHSSPSRPDLEISSPLALPPPFSISCRTSSLQFSLPDRTRSSTQSTVNQHDLTRQSSPLLPTDVPLNFDGLNMGTINHARTTPSLLPTSPDRHPISSPEEYSSAMAFMTGHFSSTPTRGDTTSYQPSSSFLGSPETPVQTLSQTEPRNPNRCHNGAFGVYNDRLPTETQPQTPADLQSPQRRAVAARNVAYTAPPGQIRTVGRLLGVDQDGEEDGAQSPTMRAVRTRERRAREYGRWMNARMESLRGSVGRAVDEEQGDAEAGLVIGSGVDGEITPDFARRRFDVQDDEAEQTGRRLTRALAHSSRSRRLREVDWRDEFEEDRVGEENF